MSSLNDQIKWYHSQPVGYRRMWWPWAATEPNFHHLYARLILEEKDDSVLYHMRYVKKAVDEGRPVK